MRRVWVGVSRTLSFADLIARYIDPWFSLPEPYFSDAHFSKADDDQERVAELVRSFGADPFDRGDYEVYSREHLPSERFDYALFQRFAPFAQSAPGLQRVRHDELTCMFFVMCDKQPAIWGDANVEITDVLDVTFDWEQS